eukprot:jgi/Chrzof1/5381/Cz16g00220.t1
MSESCHVDDNTKVDPSLEQLYAQLFGDEDPDGSIDTQHLQDCQSLTQKCQPGIDQQSCTSHVPGLAHIKGLLPEQQQAHYLSCIAGEGWFDNPACNQAMVFQHLPPWAIDMAGLIPHHMLPTQVQQRQPVFDQLIVNRYQPGEGIQPHVDLLRFEDGVAVMSLGGPAIMTFTHVADEQQQHQVLLEGGDLLVLHGAARYDWKHGIDAVTSEVLTTTGQVITRSTRTSVTFRKLCEGIVLTEPYNATDKA